MIAFRQLRLGRLDESTAGPVLDAVFASLSEHSRWLRFLVPMAHLPSSWRRQLTAVDGHDHVAFGAWVDDDPVGIGRFVSVGRGDAEVAIEIADRWHGHGIGRQLMVALIDEAARLGYRRVLADVHPENPAMRHLLGEVLPHAVIAREDGILHVSATLAAPARAA